MHSLAIMAAVSRAQDISIISVSVLMTNVSVASLVGLRA